GFAPKSRRVAARDRRKSDVTIASQQVGRQRPFNEVSVLGRGRPFYAARLKHAADLESDRPNVSRRTVLILTHDVRPTWELWLPREPGIAESPCDKVVGGTREVILKFIVPVSPCLAFDLQTGLTEAHLVGKSRSGMRGKEGERWYARERLHWMVGNSTVHEYAAANFKAKVVVEGLDLESVREAHENRRWGGRERRTGAV